MLHFIENVTLDGYINTAKFPNICIPSSLHHGQAACCCWSLHATGQHRWSFGSVGCRFEEEGKEVKKILGSSVDRETFGVWFLSPFDAGAEGGGQ